MGFCKKKINDEKQRLIQIVCLDRNAYIPAGGNGFFAISFLFLRYAFLLFLPVMVFVIPFNVILTR